MQASWITTALRTTLIDASSVLLGYLALNDAPEPADIIWGLGSHEPRVAERAAELFQRGYAPWIVFSGGKGHRWAHLERTEAELFADVATARGVPMQQIVLETRSTNTAENIQLSSAILRARGISVTRALLVTIPPFQRRASLTVKLHRPDVRCVNCPSEWGAPAGWDDEALVLVARLCAGEVRRLRDYPARGFLPADAEPPPGEMAEAAARIEAHLPVY